MSGIISNTVDYTYTTTSASGTAWYTASLAYEENAMREGFREVFKDEFKEEVPLSTGGPNIPLSSISRMRSTPAPQVKAVPPPSQPTKPIVNEQGRVKRAFDFND